MISMGHPTDKYTGPELGYSGNGVQYFETYFACSHRVVCGVHGGMW